MTALTPGPLSHVVSCPFFPFLEKKAAKDKKKKSKKSSGLELGADGSSVHKKKKKKVGVDVVPGQHKMASVPGCPDREARASLAAPSQGGDTSAGEGVEEAKGSLGDHVLDAP